MPTQQETELEQLRVQVAEVTQKAKDRKAKIETLEASVADLQGKLTTAETTLHDLQIGAPLRTLAAAVSPIPSVFMAEWSKLYKLELREGKLTVLDSKGEPVQVDDKPVEFTPEAISELVTTGDSDESKTFAHIVYGSKSGGGGAHNEHGRSNPRDVLRKPDPKEKQPPSSQFGLGMHRMEK